MAILPEHLKQLKHERLQAAQKLLERYSNVFAQEKWNFGGCDLHKLQATLKEDTQPIRVPYRAMNPTKRKCVKEPC